MATIDYKEKLRLAKEALGSGSYDKETIEYIFPELRESEDERIRKALLNEFIHLQSKGYKFAGLEGEEIIAWLEKQGEKKSSWSEEDERLCLCLIEDQKEALDKVSKDKYGHSEIISDLKEMYHERIDFLKNLKDRVQPKQEWSEKDEDLMKWSINNLIELKDRFGEEYGKVGDCIDWLKEHKIKFLRPQSHWKPSEKQIEYLSKAILTLGNEGDCKTASILNELRTDLKKL